MGLNSQSLHPHKVLHWLWLVTLALGIPLSASAQSNSHEVDGCVYPMPENSTALIEEVAKLAQKSGAPGDPQVNISFNRSEASVSVSAGGYSLAVKWQAVAACKAPFTQLLAEPMDAPVWAQKLYKTLPGDFPHQPSIQNTRSVNLGLDVCLPWLALLLSVLVFGGRSKAPPIALRVKVNYWVWGAVVLGSLYLLMRWNSGMVTDDEVAYLAIPGGDSSHIFSWHYYLKDAGLPSLVHRFVLVAIYPLGGLTALSFVHALLYLLYGVVVYRLCSELLPNGVAVVISVFCLCNPRILLYFGEHRSYASFLTMSAVGQLLMLRYIRTAHLRTGLWMMLFLGLATLDNPLCVVVPAAFTLCALLVPAWRRRLHPFRLLLATLLLALAIVPTALTASAAQHGGSESMTRWVIASCFYLLPLLFFVPGDEHLKPLRFVLLTIWLFVMAPMALELLPWNAQKIELFVLPLLLAGAATAVSGKAWEVKSLQKWALPSVVLALLLFAGLLKLHNELPELNTVTIAGSIESVDNALSERQEAKHFPVSWNRQWKSVEYASFLVATDPFTANPRKGLGLRGFYKIPNSAWVKKRCGKGNPFGIIVAPFGPPPHCTSCGPLVGKLSTWHALECR
jgi:hypothetical protein